MKIQFKNFKKSKNFHQMAYQNSINITIEAFKGLIKRASVVETRGLQIFEDYFQLFSELDDLNSNNNITLYQKYQQNMPNTSGFPGSQDEAMKQVSDIFINFFSNSNQIEKDAKKSIEALKQENSVSTANVDECLNSLCKSCVTIDSIKKTIQDNKHKLPSKMHKYQKSINGIVTLKTKLKKASEAMKLYEKMLKIRNDCTDSQRSNVVPFATQSFSDIVSKSKNSVDILKEQFKLRKDIILTIIKSNEDIMTNCEELSSQFIKSMNSINFQTDFQNFIKENKIIRYDILPDEFKPLDFSHECFSEITKVSNVLSFQLYPYSMAKVTSEFIPEDSNEISVKKGKIVLLMESLSLPWTFIQKPYTNELGYVPTSFLEEIGKGIGVLLNEYTTSDEVLNKGDYVAIESRDNSEFYVVHTISDFTYSIPATLIAIISEF